MKRIVLLVALMLGMCLLFSSCEKDGISGFIGTWSFVEEGEPDEGDYVVIEDNTITFYYGSGHGLDNGVRYKFEYEHPHIFIAGFNTYDLVSKSGNRMVWEDAGGEAYSYSYGDVYVSKKADRYVLTRK